MSSKIYFVKFLETTVSPSSIDSEHFINIWFVHFLYIRFLEVTLHLDVGCSLLLESTFVLWFVLSLYITICRRPLIFVIWKFLKHRLVQCLPNFISKWHLIFEFSRLFCTLTFPFASRRWSAFENDCLNCPLHIYIYIYILKWPLNVDV